ncbi:MAG: beta-propeller fold lactonase family protein, partial [Akkermansiaceae bacterium]|nr:beta-propeller fold lactonase family protein [Akkermansiaceae bacterium]
MKTLLAGALTGILTGSITAETVRVYLGTQGRGESKGIYVSDLDTDRGSLTAPKLAAEIGGCGFLALHPSRKYLYST